MPYSKRKNKIRDEMGPKPYSYGKRRIKAVFRKSLNRYVIIDLDTNKVIDDAQGYGYRTEEGAYKSFTYKKYNALSGSGWKTKEKLILEWLKEHKNFLENIIEIHDMLTSADGYVIPFDGAMIKRMIKEANMKTDFEPDDICIVFKDNRKKLKKFLEE